MPLRDLKHFPLLLRLCARPGFDISALRESGYYNTDQYFSGRSKFNGSLIGWAGHTENGGVISSGAKELFENLTKNNSLKDYLASVKVRTVVGREISVDVLLHTGLINYPDNCQTLDVARKNEIKEEGVKDIRLIFRRFPPNGSMFISLLGKSSACSRNLAELAFSQTGDRIGVERNWEKHFVVKILGNKFPEEDPGNDCRNYPTEHFKSYKVCDDDFLRKEVNKISPGLKPIWIVKNLSIATSQRKYSAGKVCLSFQLLKLIITSFHNYNR